MARPALHIVVKGRVQGVGYRYWTVQTARALGLTGWVRNRRDGSVEILAVGPQAALARLVDLCRRGPASARVEAVQRAPAQDDGSTTFSERPTA